MIQKLLRSSVVQFKIVHDRYTYGKYYVMYKSNFFSRWKYYRRPQGQLKEKCNLIWSWDTEKGAQTFINKQIESMNQDCITEIEFKNLKAGDRVLFRYGYEGTVMGDMTNDILTGTSMVKCKQDVKKFVCPFFKRSEIKSIVKKKEDDN